VGSFKDAMKSALVGGAIGGLAAGFKGVLNKEGFMSECQKLWYAEYSKGRWRIFAGGYFSDPAKNAVKECGYRRWERFGAMATFWERTKCCKLWRPTGATRETRI
jgi:hypothetical protein